MAKKKINVRKDYSYEAKIRLPAYERPKVQRQAQYLILRGPGLMQVHVMEENAEIKKLAARHHAKIKLLQAKTEEDAALMIKEAFTYTNAVIFNPGSLDPKSEIIRKTISKMRIPVSEVLPESGAPEYLDALKALIESK